MEKQRILYSYAAFAKNDTRYMFSANCLIAPDDMEAQTTAMSGCLLMFPLKEGWYEHKVSVTPIPEEWYRLNEQYQQFIPEPTRLSQVHNETDGMMEAGRELDALIAQKVMGFTLDYEFEQITAAPNVKELRSKDDEWGILPHYSTDITDAWEVVNKMMTLGEIELLCSNEGFTCNLMTQTGWAITANTAPLAICRAALNAVG